MIKNSAFFISMNLKIQLGKLTLQNPVMVASGTFGYAREMAAVFDLSRLGAMIPKTVTITPREGNQTPRAVETTAGLLNAIGLDNDGIDRFLTEKLPDLKKYGSPIIVSVAVKSPEECDLFGEKLRKKASEIAAVELNVSCPNVSGGTDFGTDPMLCEEIVRRMRSVTEHFLMVKLTPNVTKIAEIAMAAARGGADAVSAINTCLGMSVDWRNREPRLANVVGGLSGPAIKPIALRCVHQIYQEFRKNGVNIPIVGIGGIASAEDLLEFLVVGASAVQIGTANFYNPTAALQIIERLPQILEENGIDDVNELTGTLKY
ncbi:MAG: dihydroorotate dehydrogenase [Planctomycetaceae bacterium]|jgi:dihydroorotate dehydrogenase (NAD+) catalytic subunit|nr:dihydroorotate dehydrogenase [Planctomycetaceae bacterium]